MRKYLPTLLLASLAACTASTSVQDGYNADRNKCQNLSELKLPLYIDEAEVIDIKERNATLVTLFSDCMFDHGWTVATPARGKQFKADPGVGVGASIRPGREFGEEAEQNLQKDAAQAFSPSPTAPQNQGVLKESVDALDDGPGVVRKVPLENIQRTAPVR